MQSRLPVGHEGADVRAVLNCEPHEVGVAGACSVMEYRSPIRSSGLDIRTARQEGLDDLLLLFGITCPRTELFWTGGA
jgi:hypothetical protein